MPLDLCASGTLDEPGAVYSFSRAKPSKRKNGSWEEPRGEAAVEEPAVETPFKAVFKAIEAANTRVRELASADPHLEGMGTTLVAVLDRGEELLIASVGDSRVYLRDGQGVRPITEDQSWVNEVGRPLGFDEASLRTHPLRNVLTMAIGASPHVLVNQYSIPWTPGSMALLSSDGLHG